MTTDFERRRKSVAVHKRDQVQWSTGETTPNGVVYFELLDWLRRKDHDLANEAQVSDREFSGFLEWLNDEIRKYGRNVSPGVAALYWRWYHDEKPHGLDRARFIRRREALSKGWGSVWLDGELHSGATLVQEYLWLHQHDWILQEHIVVAIREFHEYVAAGKMPDWRRRKRRRTAAARRKAIKLLYEQALFTSVPPDDALLAPPPGSGRSRRRSHGSA